MTPADAFFRDVSGYLKPEDVSQLQSAYDFSALAHAGQYRMTGEPYVSHPVAVAQILTEWHLDSQALSAALLHDVGFIACPLLHGDFAATLLGAYVSERNLWMLRHHATFQNLHAPNLPGVDPHERERWRGNPHFDWTAEFVARYDQAASDPNYPCEPIDTFVPMVRSIFSRPPVDRRSILKETQ